MDRRRKSWTVRLPSTICILLAFLALTGCRDPMALSNVEASPESYDIPCESGKLAQPPDFPPFAYLYPRSSLEQSVANCPAELLKLGTKVLGGRIVWWTAWKRRVLMDLPPVAYTLYSESKSTGTFLEKDGTFIYISSGAELLGINEIMRRCPFKREQFQDAEQVYSLLSQIVTLHRRPDCKPASRAMLAVIMRPNSGWLEGKERDETILARLCEDPQLAFEGDTWTVIFNVFAPDGSVEKWKVIGEHDPKLSVNEILAIDTSPLKPAGTLSHPSMR